MKLMLHVAFFLSLLNQALAQAPAIQWQKDIGATLEDRLFSMQATSDGGYILGGDSYSNANGDKNENSHNASDDYWVVKLDANRNIQWQNTIGGDDADHLRCIRQTNDGGYIMAGYSRSNISGDKSENKNGGDDIWIVKVDSMGSIVWENSIGGDVTDHLYNSILQTDDGGYILAGTSNSSISGDKTIGSFGSYDYWIVKLDADGEIAWQKVYGGNDFDECWAIAKAANGGYYVGGSSHSSISGNKTQPRVGEWDYWILKIDSIGTILWQKDIGGTKSDFVRSIAATNDGGVVIGGRSDSNATGNKSENSLGGIDYWVVKLDSTGAIQWENTLGAENTEDLTSIIQTYDYGYLVSGSSFSNASGDKSENKLGGNDWWVIKLNNSGNIVWENTIGGTNPDQCFASELAVDNGYLVAGYSNSSISGDKTENTKGGSDYWIMKLNTDCPTFNFSITQTPLDCKGKTKLTVSIPTGGAAPYTYKIGNGGYQSSRSFQVSLTGDYQVTVKDANNCQTSQTISVDVVPRITVTATKTKPLCYGQSNGTATATPSGGVLPYSYLWVMGSDTLGTEQTLTGIPAGTYQVFVTDDIGCTRQMNVVVGELAILTLAIQEVLPQGSNYNVKLLSTGGTSPKLYRYCDANGENCTTWTTNRYPKNIPAGTYRFQVKDINDCITTVESAIPVNAFQSSYEKMVKTNTWNDEHWQVYPNPSSGIFTLSFTGNTDNKGLLELCDSYGKVLFSKQVEFSPNSSQKFEFSNLAGGYYTLRFVDNIGNVLYKPVVVTK